MRAHTLTYTTGRWEKRPGIEAHRYSAGMERSSILLMERNKKLFHLLTGTICETLSFCGLLLFLLKCDGSQVKRHNFVGRVFVACQGFALVRKAST